MVLIFITFLKISLLNTQHSMVYFDRSTGCWVCFCPNIFFLQYQIVTKSLGINEKYSWYLKNIYVPQNLFKRVAFSPLVSCRFGLICMDGPVAFDQALKFTLSENLYTARIMSVHGHCLPSDTVIPYESLHF